MNFVEMVKQALEKRNRILTNKKEEILLLGNKKASIDEELKENGIDEIIEEMQKQYDEFLGK